MTINGADISGWQPANVNLSGLDFVYVKATQGIYKVNAQHDAQVAQARAAGLIVGHYHFPAWGDPVQEAQAFIIGSGWQPGEFMVLDIENSPQTPWPSDPVPWCVAFENEVYGQLGIWCMDYAGPNVRSGWNWAPLAALGGGLIDPEYNNTGPSDPSPWSNVAMWQNADTNQTGGDSDVFYGDRNALTAYGTPGTTAQATTITPTQEADMTPDESAQLKAVYDAIFNGGTTMKYGASLQGLIDDIPRRVREEVAVTRGPVKTSLAQELADTNTHAMAALGALVTVAQGVGDLKAKTVATAVATVDVKALAAEVAPLLNTGNVDQFVAAIKTQWNK